MRNTLKKGHRQTFGWNKERKKKQQHNFYLNLLSYWRIVDVPQYLMSCMTREDTPLLLLYGGTITRCP